MKLLMMLSLLLIGSKGFSTEDVNEIMKKAHLSAYYQGKDGMAQLLMSVYASKDSKPLKKMFSMLRYDQEEGGKQMFFTYFSGPSDIKRTTFLVHKKLQEDDFRRLYVPSTDKVVPIAGSRKQDPFMGSDFTYEDVSGRHYTKDNHKLVGSEKFDKYDCYVTESTPKNPQEDVYSKLKAWIDKKTYTPMKVEFYDKEGKILRVYTSESMETIQGFPTIMKRVMVTPSKGTKSEILVNPKKVKYDVGLTEDLFSERSLKNPPMQYLE